MNRKTRKYDVNWFYHYANEYKRLVTQDSEIERLNVTTEFYEAILEMKKHKEILSININAPPASGKSLTSFSLANKIKKAWYKKPLNIEDVDRDQLEFSLTIRNKKIHDCIRTVDEMNELGETGENSTIEQSFFAYFSDVMAQRNIHRITCSPNQTTDKNTLIFLEVFSTDKIRKENHCKLYYKINSGGLEYKQLLGIVTIDVSEILEQPWYQEYRKRKFEKMDLILEEGIFQPLKLIYAELALNTIRKMKILTKELRLPTQSMIRNHVKSEWRRAKMGQSLVGEINAQKDCEGVLDGYKEHWRIRRMINGLQEQLKGRKTKAGTIEQPSETEKYSLKKRIEDLENSAKLIMEDITYQEEELERYKKINDKYNLKIEENKTKIEKEGEKNS